MRFETIGLIFIFAYITQAFFALRQSKHMSKVYASLVKKYKDQGDYYIGLGKSLTSFKNLTKGRITMLVVDGNLVIQELVLLEGLSVFSKFQNNDSLEGRDAEELLENEKKKDRSYKQALDNIKVLIQQKNSKEEK